MGIKPSFSTMYHFMFLLLFSILSTRANQSFIFQISTSKIFSIVVFFIFIIASKCVLFRRNKHIGHGRTHAVAADLRAVLPPGPTPWPLVGCLPAMLMNKPAHRWIHSIMKQFNTEIACIRLGSSNIHVISVSSPELALEFLKTHDSVFATRPITMTTKIMTNGFLTTALTPSGDQWKKMRKIIVSEILSPSRLHWMLEKRMEEADNLLRYVFNLTNSNNSNNLLRMRSTGISDNAAVTINLRSITRHYCGNVMRKIMFGKRYYGKLLGREEEDGGPTFEEEEHVQALFTLLSHVYAFCISDYMPCLKLFDLDGHKKTVKRALNVVKKYDDPIVDERVKQWKDGKKKEIQDILDILITLKDDQNGNNPLLSVDEIKVQITELILAGVDNPSNVMEWAMAEMLNQPEILEKAVEELDRVVGKERLVQESDIPQLKYLTACARETLRIHPVSPFNLSHIAKSDVVVGGYFIPKGSEVLLSRLGVGRNPRIWENPMRFDPNRHLKDGTVEFGLGEPSLRFISFSRGRRGCVGGSLGTTMTMILFARLLQGFSWSFPPETMKIDLSEGPDSLLLAKPLHVRAKPRLAKSLYPTNFTV